MIIHFPTALYRSVIPNKASDAGNVTFVISNTNPPRDARVVTRLPPAIERRSRIASNITLAQRRASVAAQILTISKLDVVAIQTDKKQYEIGQILEFLDTAGDVLNPMLVGDVEVLHNTNILDLSGIGLDSEEIARIEVNAQSGLNVLYENLRETKISRQEIEVAIVENQKLQNETQKAIAAIRQLVIFDGSLQSSLLKLQDKLIELQTVAANLIQSGNVASTSSSQILDQIRDVSQVVR